MIRDMTRLQRREIGLLAAVAIPAVVLASIAVALLENVVGVSSAAAMYLVAVVLTAVISGTLGAVLASVASFLLYDYLFVAPTGTFTVSDPDEWLSLILLLFVGIVVGQLAGMQRARARAAQEREYEARALFAVSRLLVTRDSTQGGLATVADVLRSQAGMSRVWIALGADEASERTVADTGSGETPVLPAVVQVLQRPPGDDVFRWIRIHQPTVRTQRRGDVDVFRVRIDVSGTSLGSVYAVRDQASGRAQHDRDAPARLGGRPDRPGRGPRSAGGRIPGGRDRAPERRPEVGPAAVRLARPADPAGDHPGSGRDPAPRHAASAPTTSWRASRPSTARWSTSTGWSRTSWT